MTSGFLLFGTWSPISRLIFHHNIYLLVDKCPLYIRLRIEATMEFLIVVSCVIVLTFVYR